MFNFIITKCSIKNLSTESYVPTSTVTQETGKVNDGNLHYITVTRELNGMVKMYIDGELATTSYQQNEQVQFNFTIFIRCLNKH